MQSAKIFSQPITNILGVQLSDNPNYLLRLPYREQLTNHVSVMHAAVIYSFAELTNGYCLNLKFPQYAETTTPLLRKSSAKYRKMVTSDLYSLAEITNGTIEALCAELDQKKKVQVLIEVKLFDATLDEVFRSQFEWFVTMNKA